MSDFSDLQKRALEIGARYDKLNQAQSGRVWDVKDRAMGFVTDVGELMELIAAKEGVRRGVDIDARLSHELSDCLWSLLLLARHYDIDLEKEFLHTMDVLDERLNKELS